MKIRENPMKEYAYFLKRKMMMSRIVGLLCCVLALASLVLYYFNLFNSWLNLITISYSVATIFTANSFLQDVKVGSPWQRVNAGCSIILYLFTVFLIVYGFIIGALTVGF